MLALAAGAYLRFHDLDGPSLWLDEILGYDYTTYAVDHPWTAWLSGFEREHGPLFYATQLMARVSESPEFAARLAPVLTCPSTTTAEAVDATGASVSYSPATAVDDVAPTSPITYSLASGALYPLGSTTVNVSSVDPSGNTST